MAFEGKQNYSERLVIDRIKDLVSSKRLDGDLDFVEDIACVALNQLPARYVRYNVDMVFYMTPKEQAQMEKEVLNAVDMAIKYVTRHRDGKRPDTYSA